ncbi:multiple epidermal growth factor-like domains protein 9, partial [Tachysurus ichikawai]
SGVCECKTGVYGDKCDDCLPGSFNFSSAGCQECQCNNHSNTCDKLSARCGGGAAHVLALTFMAVTVGVMR